MKKILFCFLTILIFGCSDQAENINQVKIDAVSSLKGDDQKLAYGTLTEIEKYAIWDQRFESAIKNENLTSEQKDLISQLGEINSLIRHLSEKKVKSIQEDWIAEAEKVFTTAQIKSLAFQLSDISDLDDNLSSKVRQEDPSFTNCNCNRGSLYSCDFPSFACPDAPSTCKNPTNYGCGFLFIHPCNQICAITED